MTNDNFTSTGGGPTPWYVQPQKSCPSCGRCNECGRGGGRGYGVMPSMPQYPLYPDPYYPYRVWCASGSAQATFTNQ